jgi:hypothetical protein
MSAVSALNQTLFHGSDHPFQTGDLIVPRKNNPGDYPDAELAYAADTQNLAKFYGKHLFTVEPIDHEKTYSRPYDTRMESELGREFYSPVGFRVTGKI